MWPLSVKTLLNALCGSPTPPHYDEPPPVPAVDVDQPRGRSSPSPSLPPEILLMIFELAVPSESYGPSSTLPKAALVCRAWRDPAQRTLFGHLRSFTTGAAARTVKWNESSAVSRYPVRSLEFGLLVSQDEEALVLDRCQGLRRLEVWDGLWTVFPRSWQNHPNLQDLKELHLNSRGFWLEPTPPFPFQLTTLKLHLPEQTIYTHGFAFLCSSSSTLTSLHLVLSRDVGPTTALIAFFAEVTFPFLHTLIIDGSYHDSDDHLLRNFSALESLEYCQRPCNSCDASVLPSVVKLLRLDWGTPDLSKLTWLLEGMYRGCFDRVGRLEIPGTSKEALETLVGLAMLEECEKRSLVVLCRYGYIKYSELAAELGHSCEASDRDRSRSRQSRRR